MEQTRCGNKRCQHSAAQRVALVADYRGSGLTQERFARSRGVSVAALRSWLYRLPGAGAGDSSPVRGTGGGPTWFVPVRLVGEDASASHPSAAVPMLVMRWPQGASMELDVWPGTPGLAELILALRGPCSR